MVQFPRVKTKGYFLMFSLVALFMGISAGRTIIHTSWGNDLVPVEIFGVFLFCVWYGVALYFFFFGLVEFQHIEISCNEIRLCMGPLVLRRISMDRIKTVGLGAMYGRGNRLPSMVLLELSCETTDVLNKKGIKLLRNRHICRRMRECGLETEGKDAGARAYLFEHAIGSAFWIEDYEDVREVLRNYLTTTDFIL